MKRTIDTTKDIGDLGERAAVRYLRLHGYRIKERNWRAGHMELDVIATRWQELVFVEVKTRTYTEKTLDTAPPPKTAVNDEKQRLTRRAARQYLLEHPSNKHPRMDVIEVWLLKTETDKHPRVARLNHIKGAY